MNRRNFLKWSGSAIPVIGALPAGAAALLSENNIAIAKKLKPEMLFNKNADHTIHNYDFMMLLKYFSLLPVLILSKK
jgi:hypothetical protein